MEIIKIRNKELTPILKRNNISEEELKLFLFNVMSSYWKRFFCWHKWIYWKFGNYSKIHRVCKKCGKKQQNRDVLNSDNI